MSPWKAVIFDFDFTLGDASHGIHDCINHGLTNMGFNSVTYEESCESIGKSLTDTLVHFVGEEHRTRGDEFFGFFMEKAGEVMVEKSVMYPDTCQVLDYLKSKNYLIAIASTKHRHRINSILAKNEMIDFFTVIVGGEDVKNHKPDPESLQLAIDMLGVRPENCVYIGDNIVDAKAAEAAGTAFISVLTGVTLETQFDNHPRIASIKSLSDLLQIL